MTAEVDQEPRLGAERFEILAAQSRPAAVLGDQGRPPAQAELGDHRLEVAVVDRVLEIGRGSVGADAGRGGDPLDEVDVEPEPAQPEQPGEAHPGLATAAGLVRESPGYDRDRHHHSRPQEGSGRRRAPGSRSRPRG
jgi:hypothetical protein